VTAGALRLGALTIRVDGAALWDPRPDWAAVRAALADEAESMQRVTAWALAIGKPGSLLETLYSPRPPADDASGAGCRALISGLRSRSLDHALAGVQILAGRGGGLTPAGDDFIVGALLAAWAGLFGAEAAALAEPMAEVAAPRTTTLSAAYLRAAARGECAAPWHRLLAALVAASDSEINAALRALLAVGHTSGADGLAGFLAGRRLAAEEPLS